MLFSTYYHPQFSINSFLADFDIEFAFIINIDDNTPVSLMYKILSNGNCFENTKSIIDHFLSNAMNENISICTINYAIGDHHAVLLGIACKVTIKIDYAKSIMLIKNKTVNSMSLRHQISSGIKPVNQYTKYSKTPWASHLNFVRDKRLNHIRDQLNLLNTTIKTVKINLIANYNFRAFSICSGNNKLLWRKINNTLRTNQKQGIKYPFDKHGKEIADAYGVANTM
ncbi:hypothetical protein PR048_007023 [Dryococelus australis]|uniref:Uncharacterized protein n=1 Tax=Dryococelus australis TaxID=614101 RepID=A0ABQ9ICH3_9NEOP|nr:hypothetical protein PR048_007023 [Dryococelus australis]